MIPINRMVPTRVTSQTALSRPGFFRELRPGQPPMIAFNWGDGSHVILLEGSYAFNHFKQQMGHSVAGVLITDVEFRVDDTSLYDPSREGALLGSLVLSEGQLSIVGRNPNNNFGDEHLVPLWGDYEEGSADVRVGFTRWSIVACIGNERETLWETPIPEEGEVV